MRHKAWMSRQVQIPKLTEIFGCSARVLLSAVLLITFASNHSIAGDLGARPEVVSSEPMVAEKFVLSYPGKWVRFKDGFKKYTKCALILGAIGYAGTKSVQSVIGVGGFDGVVDLSSEYVGTDASLLTRMKDAFASTNPHRVAQANHHKLKNYLHLAGSNDFAVAQVAIRWLKDFDNFAYSPMLVSPDQRAKIRDNVILAREKGLIKIFDIDRPSILGLDQDSFLAFMQTEANDPKKSEEVARELFFLKSKKSIPILRSILDNPLSDQQARTSAAYALAYYRDSYALPELIHELTNDADKDGSSAVVSLWRLQDPRSESALLKAAGDPQTDDYIRRESLRALLDLHSPKGVDLALAETDKRLTDINMFTMLGNSESPKVKQYLFDLGDRPDIAIAVKSNAWIGLSEMDLSADEKARLVAQINQNAFGPHAVDLTKSPEIMGSALSIAAAAGSQSARMNLLTQLTLDNENAPAVISALSYQHDPLVVAFAIRLLRQSTTGIDPDVTSALVRMRAEEALPALKQLFSDPALSKDAARWLGEKIYDLEHLKPEEKKP